jgi:hypothetical protein
MPIRLVREGILTSKRMAQLDWAEEVFFRRLLSVVDDFGRYHADPGLLRAACYPRQLSKVSEANIGSWLLAAMNAGLVVVYGADDGETYVQVLRFGQQIRSKHSKFPDPPDNAEQLLASAKQSLANAHSDVSECGDEDGDVNEDGGDTARARGRGASAADPPPGFERFWSAYPNTGRKVGKGKCMQTWRAKKLEPEAEAIVAHVTAMRDTEQWRSGYEPAPTTYLSQERWRDPVPRAGPRNEARAYFEATLSGDDDGTGNTQIAGGHAVALRRGVSP